MLLNKISSNIIERNMDKVKKCNIDYSDIKFDELKNYIYIFYIRIYSGNKFINKNNKYIEKKIEENKIFDKSSKPLMWDSNFFPDNIKKYIEEERSTMIKYTIKIESRIFSLYFYIFNDDEILNNIDNYAKNVFIWLYIANQYINKNCSNYTNIYIYLTPFLKKLPTKSNKILDHNNVNTAFTMGGCNEKGEIIIYRKEEWFKVLIHECFHSFDLDFSLSNIEKIKYKIKKQFNVKSDLLVYESYCEVWARIINCLITAYACLKNKKNIKRYMELSNIFLQLERIYSLQQCNNILNYMNISYDNLLIDKKNNYNENSNVFCYYVLGAILMSDYYRFMDWCYKNNRYFIKFSNNPGILLSYGNLIIDIGIKGEFLKGLECVKMIAENVARMTCIEL
jgi:hypothetical protein